MHKTGCSGLVHWDDPEGWDGEGGGRGFGMVDTHTPVADSCQLKKCNCCLVAVVSDSL